jgi:hypothetical protein
MAAFTDRQQELFLPELELLDPKIPYERRTELLELLAELILQHYRLRGDRATERLEVSDE